MIGCGYVDTETKIREKRGAEITLNNGSHYSSNRKIFANQQTRHGITYDGRVKALTAWSFWVKREEIGKGRGERLEKLLEDGILKEENVKGVQLLRCGWTANAVALAGEESRGDELSLGLEGSEEL